MRRIEYIDALRGFTMILVVLGHVPMYAYRSADGVSFSLLPTTFHMALFFFLSGWFVPLTSSAPINMVWLKKKVMQLVVPTVMFYSLYCYLNGVDVIENLWNDKYKAGYWFCIVLFGFNLIVKAFSRTGGVKTGLLILLSFVFLLFNTNALARFMGEYGVPNVLCLQQWEYFGFFCLGGMASAYKERFFALLDNRWFTGAAILAFVMGQIFLNGINGDLALIIARFVIYGLCGTLILFAFFRRHEVLFSNGTFAGRMLQYIGRRTLDIYLLHYFFLPRHLEAVGAFFRENPNPTIELFVSGTLSLMVIALCLAVSNVVRLSPVLAYCLFGVKAKSIH